MLRYFRGFPVLLSLTLATILASGCHSNGGNSSATATADSGTGMYCPKCETVWIRTPSRTGRVNLWRSDKKMTCPDCDAMAKSRLMEDGKVMLHECPTCKVTPQAISPADHALHGKGPHTN